MFSILTNLQARCEEREMLLCGAGTHPFCQRLVPITPVQRHRIQCDMAAYLSYWLTFAQHVHVGMHSGDEAVAIAKILKPYLPILLALSANSPFWQGYDTGYASFRQRFKELLTISASVKFGKQLVLNKRWWLFWLGN